MVTVAHPLTPKSGQILWYIFLFLLFGGFKVGVWKKETLRKSIVGVVKVCLFEILNLLSPMRVSSYLLYVNVVV